MILKPSKPLDLLGRAAAERGADLYHVGGAVRDRLLGFEAADEDLAGPMKPQELARLRLPGITVLDPVNGLGTALLQTGRGEDKTTYEYTAFRTDSYSRGGDHLPAEVTFTEDITLDALRRDFTVNALYVRLPDGEVLDPTGQGLADLKSRTLRMVRPQTLSEDALRILRLIRFASALGFEVEQETFRAAKANAEGLRDISWERIQSELFRILLGDTVYGQRDAVARGLYMMRDLGVLEYVIPELLEGQGFVQSPQYHRFDVLDHQIETCAAAPAELVTRLAALLHDVSKPESYRTDGNMHRHAEMGAQRTELILRRLRAPRRLAAETAQLVQHHMFDLTNAAKEKAVIRRLNLLGRDQFRRLADLREADFAGSGMHQNAESAAKWRGILAALERDGVPLTVSELAVTGSDIIRELHLKPGPAVGEILSQLLEHVQLRPSQNSYKSLVKYARMIAAGIAGADRSASETS